jgi:hypothetical protein
MATIRRNIDRVSFKVEIGCISGAYFLGFAGGFGTGTGALGAVLDGATA